jgi:hypothetical protein
MLGRKGSPSAEPNPSKDMSVNCACQLCPDRVHFGSDDQTFYKAFGGLKTTARARAVWMGFRLGLDLHLPKLSPLGLGFIRNRPNVNTLSFIACACHESKICSRLPELQFAD